VSGTYYEVTTLGDMAEDRPAKPTDFKAEDGCHWFETCSACKWPDCVVDRRAEYCSDIGRRLRARGMARMLWKGKTIGQVAEFMGMAAGDVLSELAKMSGVSRAFARPGAVSDAVRLRGEGKPEKAVAKLLGVSPRQVRRWVERSSSESLPSGVRRTDGNRWRGRMPELDGVKVAAPGQGRVDRRAD